MKLGLNKINNINEVCKVLRKMTTIKEQNYFLLLYSSYTKFKGDIY